MNSTPGDVGFASQPGFINWWIRLAQRRKYGKYSPCARWNHVFMVTDTSGGIIQAVSRGMVRGHVSDYAGQDIEVRRPPYGPTWVRNGSQMGGLTAAEAMEELWADHDHYGFLTIASVALALLTGTKLRFGIDGTEICSGAVAYALTRANIDVGQDCEFNTPADLFSYAIAQNWTRP
jgi:hypothetical protein